MVVIFVDAKPEGTHLVLHSSTMLYAMLTAFQLVHALLCRNPAGFMTQPLQNFRK